MKYQQHYLEATISSILLALLCASLVVDSASAFVIPTKTFAGAPAGALARTCTRTPIWVLAASEVDESYANIILSAASAAAPLRGKTIVVKYGGNAMTSTELKNMFCQDVAALQLLGIRVVVVHGGGPQINSMLEKLGVESRFEGGMRVSSKEVVDVAEMVLSGSVNKEIASKICSQGGRAAGLSGRDDSMLQCVKEENKDGVDLQFVGNIVSVNTNILMALLNYGVVPVVSPIGTGIDDEKNIAYNVNADVAAGRIAAELRAECVIFLTDIAGVLDKNKELIPTLSIARINELITDETITGGMIPKVSYARSAVESGVEKASITDGRVPHALLKAVLSGGENIGGTVVTK